MGGRAIRTTTLSESVRGDTPAVSVGGIAADAEATPTIGDRDVATAEEPTSIGDEPPEEMPSASDLFEPAATARVMILQNVVPVLATGASYLVFRFSPLP